MERRKLGDSGLSVSVCCLGTMTWGEQNTEAEAHAQMDRAVERGVNVFDTAELYPVPRRAETHGATEAHIGSWFRARPGMREAVLIATKVIGRSDATWFRPWDDAPRLDARNVDSAVEQSLQRLGVDTIDLYQVHWPDRLAPMFGAAWYQDYPRDDVPIADTLGALARWVEKGAIRAVGVSNETPWGLSQYLTAARDAGLPRVVSVQNAYHLLNRDYETGLAEFGLREDVGLLAYSPLAFGFLTGKYAGGVVPPGSRGALFPQFMQRYLRPEVETAVSRYTEVAKDFGLTLTQLALKFVATRAFCASTIIGATTLAQLDENIDAFDAPWSDEVEAAVNAVHTAIRNPCP